MANNESNADEPTRPHAMGLLARGRDLLSLWSAASTRPDAPRPHFRWVRAPERGLAMVRGRMSGTGTPFNLGEVTVTRCTLETEKGYVGTAYVQGRDTEHATIAALADALFQDPRNRRWITTHLLEPLEIRERANHAASRAATDATKVDFFTLVRGDN